MNKYMKEESSHLLHWRTFCYEYECIMFHQSAQYANNIQSVTETTTSYKIEGALNHILTFFPVDFEVTHRTVLHILTKYSS